MSFSVIYILTPLCEFVVYITTIFVNLKDEFHLKSSEILNLLVGKFTEDFIVTSIDLLPDYPIILDITV